MYNGGDNPSATNRISFTADNLKSYIDAQKIGFFFADGIKYKADPQINHSNNCNNCGDLKHCKKTCKNRQICMKCSESGHIEAECKASFDFCFRCQTKNHRCDSDICEKLAEKTFEQNRFVLSILLGEQIINSRYEILQTIRNNATANVELI